jgi:hypothetical protein
MAKGKQASSATRVRKSTKLGKRRYEKTTTRKFTPLPGSFKLVADSFRVIKRHWRVLGRILGVYLILNAVFVGALSNIGGAVDQIRLNFLESGSKHFVDAISGLGALIGSAGASGSGSASVLQLFLIIIESLVIIWALRQLLAGQPIGAKQAYYSATTPLIPFLLVLAVFFVQLLPLTLGSALISALATSLFSSSIASFIIGTIVFFLAAWSFYMLSGSIFALYIVTLPDMEPRKALRSAKNLVRFRRWAVIRKCLFLPLFLLMAFALIIVPLILWVDILVAPIFFFLTMFSILFIHTYLYNLYRGLLE